MIFLIAQKEGHLQTFTWKTSSDGIGQKPVYDAIISSTCQPANYNIGLISHPQLNDNLPARLMQELNNKTMTHIMIVSRDQTHQENLQKVLADLQSHANVNSILLGTHQDLYKSGLAKARWHNLFSQQLNFSINGSLPNDKRNFGTIEAA